MSKVCYDCDYPYVPDSTEVCPNCGADNGCFITTAVCKYMNKPDDTWELQALRAFRERKMLESPESRALLGRYEEVAPEVVAWIARHQDKAAVHAMLLEEFIIPSAENAKAGRDLEARRLYVTMMNWLMSEVSGEMPT